MRNGVMIAGLGLGLALSFLGCAPERSSRAQQQAASDAPAAAPAPGATEEIREDGFQPNLSVVIREGAINDLIAAVGTLERESHVLFKSKATNYKLIVPPATVEIGTDSAIVRTNVTVKVLGEEYTAQATGKANVTYDPQQNELFLEIGKLMTDIHVDVLGLTIDLDEVDISAFYTPKIKLLGQLPLATDFKVKKPGEADLPVRFAIARHRIRYVPNEVILDMVVDFHSQESAAR